MAKPIPRAHTVLITGGTAGIGLLLAQAYASRGHKVLVTGRQLVLNDVEFFGAENIIYIRADQENPAKAAQAIQNALNEFGWKSLDLAILNAGIGWTSDPAEETGGSIRRQIAVNMTAPILICQAIAPLLFEANGQVVFIGSTAIKGQGGFATYSATKAALDGFARSLREEWRGRALVQIIHPGPTRTDMHKKAGLDVGLGRMFFMSAKAASRSIQVAIRDKQNRKILSRFNAFSARFSRSKQGLL